MYKNIIRHNKLWVSASFLLIISSAITMVYAGYSLSFFLSAYNATDNAVGTLLSESIKILFIWFIALLFLYVSNIAKSHTIRLMSNDLRNIMSKKITQLNYLEFTSKDSGNYVSWLTNDINQIAEQAFSPMFTLVENIATAIFSFIAMCGLSIYIGLSSLLLFAFTFIIPQLISKVVAKASKDLSIAQEEAVESFKESIMGLQLLKQYNQITHFINRIKHTSEKLETTKFAYSSKQVFVNTIVAGVNLVGQVILLFVTVYLAILKMTPVGAVLSVGNLAGSFFSNVGAIMQNVITLKASKPVFQKFICEDPNDHITTTISDIKNIEITNLSYAYDKISVLENKSFTFMAHKKYAIIGSSGCGKSTLAHIMLGLLPNYYGSVQIDNRELHDINLASLYQQITYIDQNVYLFKASIRDNVTLNEDFSDEEVNDALRKSMLSEFIRQQKDGIHTLIEENGRNLSGGQRQRIAIARALIRNVKYIIIDEGTSALDKENAVQIEKQLIKLDCCIIIISHHLSDAIRNELDVIYEL